VPQPRKSLTITADRSASRTGIGIVPDIFEDLRRMYGRAFEKLDREGRYEEAAFVLAELLQESEEAVLYLEGHGLYTLAAQLAESRELAPSMIVREWFLAGRIDRAIQIARRSGAFQDAVLWLERSHAKEAERLRLLWADALADAGNYMAAVEV